MRSVINRIGKAVVALATVLGTPCAAQQRSSTPRFTFTADTVLVDDNFRITVTDLPPRALITVRLSGADSARGWHSSATFRADPRGEVDLARTAPVSGTYSGVHALGLFWSAARDSTAAPLVRSVLRTPDVARPQPQPWVLTAELNGRAVATDTVWRRALNPDVRIVPVRESGLVGTLYVPPGSDRHPAVIVLNGSQGGIAPPEGLPGGFASRGYVVLALGYFAAEGLPAKLANIPLEYFGTAMRWLATQPSVDSTRIGIVGQSRGAELALLLGATFPQVHAIVGYAPSHVVWPGTLNDPARAPAWTRAGQPVPGVYSMETPEAVARLAGCPSAPTCSAPLTLHQFLALLEDSAAVARAEIPVERINGAVLLISGRDDGIWPSSLMADRVVARLYANRFARPFEHIAYPGAGHAIGRPHVALPDVARSRSHEITGRAVTPGGTPEGTALASEDSWRRVLDFLDANLRMRK